MPVTKTRSGTVRAPAFGNDIHAFIKSFVKDIADGTAAIFAGAGLSVASGYVNWADLMRDIAIELDLDVDREMNLVAIAQYHFNQKGNRSSINQKLVDEFSAGHDINENHRILARLPIATYWTTNYDHLIEDALTNAGKTVDVKYDVNHLKVTRRNRNVTLYKMHGDVLDPEHAVLTKDDYEGYFRDRELFVTALTGDLVSKTVLFVGFSFTDPNIDYIMSRVRVVLRKQPKNHYCILRKEARRPREKREHFEYRLRQQQYFIKDLSRIGIHALMVDDYKDVTLMLQTIEERFKQRTIFVSGSAYDFGKWAVDRAGQLIEQISGALVAAGMNVVTGFGLGVGPSVIAGSLRMIYARPRRCSRNQLQTEPFPVVDEGTTDRKRLYTRHRQDMIARCGIALFLFGNKRDKKGKIVVADGVREEYEIAKELGAKIVPVGCTGWVAEEIAGIMEPDFRRKGSSLWRAFQTLNKPKATNDQIANAVLAIVKEYRSE